MGIEKAARIAPVLLSLILAGCRSLALIPASAPPPLLAPAGAPAAVFVGKLMLFGGASHQAYLGCLNCPASASDSILNEYGAHGSRYDMRSIVNQFSDFGSAYSNYSACNAHATDAPVVVDSAGRFYGRLTMNLYNSERYSQGAVNAWLAGMCAR
jgi:hypothetical protein